MMLKYLSLTHKNCVNFKIWAQWAPGRVTFYFDGMMPNHLQATCLLIRQNTFSQYADLYVVTPVRERTLIHKEVCKTLKWKKKNNEEISSMKTHFKSVLPPNSFLPIGSTVAYLAPQCKITKSRPLMKLSAVEQKSFQEGWVENSSTTALPPTCLTSMDQTIKLQKKISNKVEQKRFQEGCIGKWFCTALPPTCLLNIKSLKETLTLLMGHQETLQPPHHTIIQTMTRNRTRNRACQSLKIYTRIR